MLSLVATWWADLTPQQGQKFWYSGALLALAIVFWVFRKVIVKYSSRLIAWSLRPCLIHHAREKFQTERSSFEEEFMVRANERGIPRGLIWVKCDFESETHFVINRESRQLQALVAVTIGFEAEPGGDMEGVEAVGNLRAGTAVFFTDARKPNNWETVGRAIFNLDPLQAIEHFQGELEVVPEKLRRWWRPWLPSSAMQRNEGTP